MPISNLIPQPSEDQAMAFATMLLSGLPAQDAILYFIDVELSPLELAQMLSRWRTHYLVKRSMTTLMGKPWQKLSDEERHVLALRNHYNQLAYVLWNSHYADAQGNDKQKLDTARQALEAKVAGTAGKNDPLTQFFADIESGKVKLNKPLKGPSHVEKVSN